MNTFPLRYLGWMAGDVVRGPGIPIVVLGALALLVEFSVNAAIANAVGGPVNGVEVLGVYRVGTAFVVLATAGIVSRDLAGGYSRTLFARPVHPMFYYLQRWLIGGGVVLLAVLLMDVAMSVRLHVPMASPGLLGRAALMYLLLGGLILLLSTVTRYDWVLAVVLMLGHGAVGTIRDAFAAVSVQSTWIAPAADAIYKALPPFHLIGLTRPIRSSADALHIALYGTAILLAALLVLRRRPLGSAMRQ